ncbi:MAG: BMP family ABC transporter substrate-binding protein [Candidatus Neoclostridium sp.]
MKKIITILLAVVTAVTCCFAFAACTPTENPDNGGTTIKAGLITLHDDNSTYDKNFIDAFKAACKAKGVEAVIKTGIGEDESCTTAANELVEEGCKFVFADSFGHEDFLKAAAQQHPDVEFAHATGVSMQNDTTANFHNAFASIYEGRFLAGYAAGLKLKAMYEADNTIAKDGVITVGYVGAYPYAEVKSGYTSWLLGVRRAMEEVEGITVNMKVQFTFEWYEETKEANAAKALIDAGCVLISQHADSWGAPTTCEAENVPNVSYNGSTESRCPKTFIVSSKINWQPYFEYALDNVKAGTSFAKDWTAGMGEDIYTGSVCLSAFGAIAPVAGTADAVAAVAAQLKAGTVKVFDTSKFAIQEYVYDDFSALTEVTTDANGKMLTAKQNGVSVIKTANGITYFDESNTETNRSAPYFDINIVGIEIVG